MSLYQTVQITFRLLSNTKIPIIYKTRDLFHCSRFSLTCNLENSFSLKDSYSDQINKSGLNDSETRTHSLWDICWRNYMITAHPRQELDPFVTGLEPTVIPDHGKIFKN